jgi:hypothetical protein
LSFSSTREPLDGVVVGCFEGGKLTSEGALLNDLTKGELQKQWNMSFKKGKDGDSVTLFGVGGFPRIAIVGLGKERVEFGETLKQKNDWKEIVRRAAATGAALLKANGARRIGIESFGGEYQGKQRKQIILCFVCFYFFPISLKKCFLPSYFLFFFPFFPFLLGENCSRC